MTRSAGCAAAASLALVAMAANAARADSAPPQIAGVWLAEHASPHLLPSSGPVPFTPAGRAQYAKTVAGLRDGSIVDGAVRLCLPEGTPRALTSAYPFEIIVTPGQVTFVHEANRAYRTVALNGHHADPNVWDPSYMGDGIANWAGHTLVIDSTNFKTDKIYLDSSGLPAGPKLHVIEHVTLSKGGRELDDLVTIDDPDMFTKPWSAKLVFQRRDDLRVATDWICGRPHRALPIPKARATAPVTAGAIAPGHAALDGYWHDILPPGAPMLPTPADVFAKMAPATAAKFHQDQAAALAGQFVGDPETECLPAAIGGTGTDGGLAYSKEILIAPAQVAFLTELDRGVHFATVGGALPTVLAPSWQGTSVANWQGDTLVVETAGFNGKSTLYLGVNPKFRSIDNFVFSTKMHLVERYRILPNGQLEDIATFDDPVAFTAPFTLTTHFVRTQPFQEYICAENNSEGGVPTSDGGITPFSVPKP